MDKDSSRTWLCRHSRSAAPWNQNAGCLFVVIVSLCTVAIIVITTSVIIVVIIAVIIVIIIVLIIVIIVYSSIIVCFGLWSLGPLATEAISTQVWRSLYFTVLLSSMQSLWHPWVRQGSPCNP